MFILEVASPHIAAVVTSMHGRMWMEVLGTKGELTLPLPEDWGFSASPS